MSDLKDNIEGGTRRVQLWGAGVIIFMIVLMLLPWNLGDRSQGSGDFIVGTANGRKITSADRQQASRLLETLERMYVTIINPMDESMSGQIPLPTAVWGDTIATQLKRSPEALLLLVEESNKYGPGVNPQALGELEPDKQSAEAMGLLNSGAIQVSDLHPLPQSLLAQTRQRVVQVGIPGRPQANGYVPFHPANTLSRLDQQIFYFAMRDLLAIQSAAALVQSAVKPTTPMINRLVAREMQKVTLETAEFDARQWMDKTPEPSEAELQEQLKQFAATPAGPVTKENPFGFGYQVANSVKLQMILLHRDDIRAIVEPEKSRYNWEVEARMAFATNPESFSSLATTQPTTEPSTTEPSTAEATTTQPVANFEQVREGAIRMMIDRAVDARLADIEKRMRSAMIVDHQNWLTARSTNAQTRPASSLGVPYDSLDYLDRLAADIQSKFKILPTVQSLADRFRDGRDLALNPDIARLVYRLPMNVAQSLRTETTQLGAPEYLVQFARPFMERRALELVGDSSLDLFKPSERLSDPSGATIAIVRLIDTKAAHPAADIAPIREQLTIDWKRARAQQQALDAANAAAKAAALSGNFTFGNAKLAAVVLEPGGSPPAELGFSPQAFHQFRQQVGDTLLSNRDGQPIGVLNVPLAQKTYVARRVKLEPTWQSQEELDMNRQFLRASIASQMAQPRSANNPFALTDTDVMSDWLNVEQILARNAWKATASEK